MITATSMAYSRALPTHRAPTLRPSAQARCRRPRSRAITCRPAADSARPIPESHALSEPLWDRCLSQLESELSEQQLNTWIRPLQALEDGAQLRIMAPNRFVLDMVQSNFHARIQELAAALSENGDVIVNLVIGTGGEQPPDRAACLGGRRTRRGRSAVRPARPVRADGEAIGGHRGSRPPRLQPQSAVQLRHPRRGQVEPARSGGGHTDRHQPGAPPTTPSSSTAPRASGRRT